MQIDEKLRPALTAYTLRLGDNALVLGHRISQWTSNGPTVELDIALTNHALDLLGQARMLLTYAGEVEGRKRDEDTLAYLRDADEFQNIAICELPNGDFGFTVMRQLLFACATLKLFEALTGSKDETLAAIAAKGEKELNYHVRHCGEWVVRLGDGTDESHARIAKSLEELWPYTEDLFAPTDGEDGLVAAGLVPDRESLRTKWHEQISSILARATLSTPQTPSSVSTGHTEYLAPMLAEMQVLKRQFPNATW